MLGNFYALHGKLLTAVQIHFIPALRQIGTEKRIQEGLHPEKYNMTQIDLKGRSGMILQACASLTSHCDMLATVYPP